VLVGELEEADLVVIGLPVYNFSVPATLKAWIDQVCRARRTFAFSEEGPVGLLKGKRAIVVYVSGGTPFGSEIDYASGYMKHILGFIGISGVTFVKVERFMFDPDAINRAKEDAGKLADPFLSASSA
jgi:FMN-dependent NADH-azoreductase